MAPILETVFDFSVKHIVVIILSEPACFPVEDIKPGQDLKPISQIVADFGANQGAVVVQADVRK